MFLSLTVVCAIQPLALRAAAPARAAAPGAQVAEAIPTVDQVLARSVQALGGKERLLKVTSRHLKGTLELPSLSMTVPWEQKSKAPNKRHTVIEAAGMSMTDGYDGVMAWSKNQGGVQEKKGQELARLKRDCEFHRELRLKDIYERLTVKGRQDLDGKAAYVVEAKPVRGEPEQYYFEVESGLLVRWDSAFENETGKYGVRVEYGDYREVEGVKIPFLAKYEIETPNSSKTALVVKCASVRLNESFDDAIFNKPAD